jgi:hypothetical protein
MLHGAVGRCAKPIGLGGEDPSPQPPPRKQAGRGWTSDPLVLPAQRRWQAPEVPGRERRDGLPNPDPAGLEADQPGSGQLGQVERLPKRAPSAGGGDQTEEVGHRPWPQHRRPVAADVGVIRGVARCLMVMVGPKQRGHQRPAAYRGRCGARSAREWRGFHRDGRTGVLVHKYQGPDDTVWAIVANVLFLHKVACLVGAASTWSPGTAKVEPRPCRWCSDW